VPGASGNLPAAREETRDGWRNELFLVVDRDGTEYPAIVATIVDIACDRV